MAPKRKAVGSKAPDSKKPKKDVSLVGVYCAAYAASTESPPHAARVGTRAGHFGAFFSQVKDVASKVGTCASFAGCGNYMLSPGPLITRQPATCTCVTPDMYHVNHMHMCHIHMHHIIIIILLLLLLQTRASWDQVLARCVQLQSAVSRLVCFEQACTTSTQP